MATAVAPRTETATPFTTVPIYSLADVARYLNAPLFSLFRGTSGDRWRQGPLPISRTPDRLPQYSFAEFAALYPETPEQSAVFCAPRLEPGFVVEAIRRHLMARAGILITTRRPGPLLGHVERLADGVAEGWAVDSANPGLPVDLEMLVDGVPTIRLLANRHREDLARAGLADGRCSFLVACPPALKIRFRRAEDGAMLPERAPTRRVA